MWGGNTLKKRGKRKAPGRTLVSVSADHFRRDARPIAASGTPPPATTSPLSCSSSCADHSSRTCEGLRLLWYLDRHWKAVRRGARWRCPGDSPSFSASWQAMVCQSWSWFASATRLSFANSSRVHSLWRTPVCSWLIHLAEDVVAGRGV